VRPKETNNALFFSIFSTFQISSQRESIGCYLNAQGILIFVIEINLT